MVGYSDFKVCGAGISGPSDPGTQPTFGLDTDTIRMFGDRRVNGRSARPSSKVDAKLGVSRLWHCAALHRIGYYPYARRPADHRVQPRTLALRIPVRWSRRFVRQSGVLSLRRGNEIDSPAFAKAAFIELSDHYFDGAGDSRQAAPAVTLDRVVSLDDLVPVPVRAVRSGGRVRPPYRDNFVGLTLGQRRRRDVSSHRSS